MRFFQGRSHFVPFFAGAAALLTMIAPAVRAQDLYVSSAGTPGEIGTDAIYRFNGAPGAFIDTFAASGSKSPSWLTFGPAGDGGTTPPPPGSGTAVPASGTSALIAAGLLTLAVCMRRAPEQPRR